MNPQLIRLAHSPDPDDAFMFWALAKHKIDSGAYQFEHILSDIQTLNEKAKEGLYEVSAISFYTYPFIADRYALLGCGSSMGDNYGPMVVGKKPWDGRSLSEYTLAIPGKMTTAYLALQLYAGSNLRTVVIPFDQILDAVEAGQVDAGLIIHEGQLTYQKQGLQLWVDLGKWWYERHQLPLPLGGNVIRRDLGAKVISEVAAILKQSIQVGLEHRQEALDYALGFGRGLNPRLADEFVGMYVNDLTVDYGERGRTALKLLFEEARKKNLVPEFELAFVG